MSTERVLVPEGVYQAQYTREYVWTRSHDGRPVVSVTFAIQDHGKIRCYLTGSVVTCELALSYLELNPTQRLEVTHATRDGETFYVSAKIILRNFQ